MAEKNTGVKIIADNRQARFMYEILDTYEAGISLQGTEVKSIRAGKTNLRDGYGNIHAGELWLYNVHISPHATTGDYFNHEAKRPRKLLLHKKEIRQLIGKVEQQGLTLVPLKLYFKNGRIKVAIALARGKKLHDKREDIKQRQDKRDMARAMKQY